MPGVTRWKRPDVVHFPWNGRVGPFLPASVVTTVHDVLPLAIPGYFVGGEEELYRRGLSRDLARSDVLITDSEFSRSELKDIFGRRSIPSWYHRQQISRRCRTGTRKGHLAVTSSTSGDMRAGRGSTIF